MQQIADWSHCSMKSVHELIYTLRSQVIQQSFDFTWIASLGHVAEVHDIPHREPCVQLCLYYHGRLTRHTWGWVPWERISACPAPDWPVPQDCWTRTDQDRHLCEPERQTSPWASLGRYQPPTAYQSLPPPERRLRLWDENHEWGDCAAIWANMDDTVKTNSL